MNMSTCLRLLINLAQMMRDDHPSKNKSNKKGLNAILKSNFIIHKLAH
jgi:hypothetical protein